MPTPTIVLFFFAAIVAVAVVILISVQVVRKRQGIAKSLWQFVKQPAQITIRFYI